MNTLHNKLNKQLANGIVFYQKLRHYHWEVQGEQFFRLHEKFEEMYTRWADVNDDLAERNLMIGGRPIGTLKDAIELAEISEDPSTPNYTDMVCKLLDDMNVMVKGFNGGIKAAEEAGDYGTADMLTGFIRDMQKDGWMLRSFLSKQDTMAQQVSHERVAAM